MDLFFEIIWILVMTRLLFKHLWVEITTREVKKVEKMRFNARGHAVSLLSWIIIGKTNLECVFFFVSVISGKCQTTSVTPILRDVYKWFIQRIHFFQKISSNFPKIKWFHTFNF